LWWGFLQAIYRSPYEPISRRLRAAIAALPFEHPKLAVVARIGGNVGFGEQLEAAMRRVHGQARGPADGARSGPVIDGEIVRSVDRSR
jgi:hypothetical protein